MSKGEEMSNTLYLECNTGISGDMMVASLLDLGVEEAVLRTALDSLHLSGYQIQISRVKKSGLDVSTPWDMRWIWWRWAKN